MISRSDCSSFRDVIKALGLVFGDVGTSPVYTLSIVFLFLPVTRGNVLGVLSLIVWTLTLVVFTQYAVLAMTLSRKGEGGTVVLRELLMPLLTSPGQKRFVTLLSFVGMSLLIGDGVLTPAMSVLSAIEGILLIPGYAALSRSGLIIGALCLAVFLFALQRKGTDNIAGAFGPIMLIWFLLLALSGCCSLVEYPAILTALSPHHAVMFMFNNGVTGFFVLSDIILCATGGEALYADMGHLGRTPIRKAGVFVFGALLLTYLGQGAFLLNNPDVGYVFYEMFLAQIGIFYVPFLILCIFVSIIASQAMISSIFSVVYQGITTKIFPTLKVGYTSSKFRSQIYVGFINWFLLFAVCNVIVYFKASHRLAAAYGFAVTGTMTVTGIMMTWIFYRRSLRFKTLLASLLTCINLAFFLSSTCKIPHGGYVSVLLACIPLTIMLIYTRGRQKIAAYLRSIPLDQFLSTYLRLIMDVKPLPGTALFFVKNVHAIEPYVTQTMFDNSIIYDDNIIITVTTRDDPYGVVAFFKGDLAQGLRVFEIHMGYMEVINIAKILDNAGIFPKVIFYGQEDIVTTRLVWKMLTLIKRVTPHFVRFYHLPPSKLHGVVTMVEL